MIILIKNQDLIFRTLTKYLFLSYFFLIKWQFMTRRTCIGFFVSPPGSSGLISHYKNNKPKYLLYLSPEKSFFWIFDFSLAWSYLVIKTCTVLSFKFWVLFLHFHSCCTNYIFAMCLQVSEIGFSVFPCDLFIVTTSLYCDMCLYKNFCQMCTCIVCFSFFLVVHSDFLCCFMNA